MGIYVFISPLGTRHITQFQGTTSVLIKMYNQFLPFVIMTWLFYFLQNNTPIFIFSFKFMHTDAEHSTNQGPSQMFSYFIPTIHSPQLGLATSTDSMAVERLNQHFRIVPVKRLLMPFRLLSTVFSRFIRATAITDSLRRIGVTCEYNSAVNNSASFLKF